MTVDRYSRSKNMSQIVLILPGATDFELQGRIHGDLDIPLCPEGREEAGRVGRELQDLGIEVIYTSCCSSARETAEAIGGALQVKIKKLDNMQNLDQGLWQGLLVEEVKQKQPKVYRQWLEQPETMCPPEGETIDSARERVATVLTKLLKKHAGGVIGLIVPEPLASVVREHLGDGELGDLWRATSEHGCWSVIVVDAEGKSVAGPDSGKPEQPSAKPVPSGPPLSAGGSGKGANGNGANGNGAGGNGANGSGGKGAKANGTGTKGTGHKNGGHPPAAHTAKPYAAAAAGLQSGSADREPEA
jgi:phosphoserine phosphatase